jgi:hypothetical protein
MLKTREEDVLRFLEEERAWINVKIGEREERFKASEGIEMCLLDRYFQLAGKKPVGAAYKRFKKIKAKDIGCIIIYLKKGLGEVRSAFGFLIYCGMEIFLEKDLGLNPVLTLRKFFNRLKDYETEIGIRTEANYLRFLFKRSLLAEVQFNGYSKGYSNLKNSLGVVCKRFLNFLEFKKLAELWRKKPYGWSIDKRIKNKTGKLIAEYIESCPEIN